MAEHVKGDKCDTVQADSAVAAAAKVPFGTDAAFGVAIFFLIGRFRSSASSPRSSKLALEVALDL